jgi:O-antigen/teichoic acid export membrane protein
MGIVFRQSAKIIFITYTGFALGYINTVIFYPLVLSKEEIGLIRILISASFLFATFASLGAANIPMKFFPYFRDHEKQHNGILFFILALGAAGYILFILFFFIFKNDIASIYSANAPMLIDYFYFFLPFTFIALFLNIFDSYVVIQQKAVVSNLVKEFLVRFFVTIGIILLLFNLINYQHFVIFIIAGYAVSLLVLIIYIQSQGLLFLKPNLSVFKSQYFKSILVFGFYILLGNTSGTIIANIDSLMLAAYKGLSVTGVYTVAFFIAAVIEIPRRSLSQAIFPLVSESNKNEDIKTLEMLYKKSSINQMIAGASLFILIWCNIENIFSLMPNGEDFVEGKWVVFWIGLSKFFDLATGANAEIVGTSKYYKVDLLFYIFLAVVGIIFNIIFIPIYGLNGAAFGSAMAIFLFNIVRYLFLLKVFRIQPFTLNSLKMLAAGMFILLINYLLPVHPSFIFDLIYRSIVLIILFSGTVVLLNISEDVNNILNKIILLVKNKLKKK